MAEVCVAPGKRTTLWVKRAQTKCLALSRIEVKQLPALALGARARLASCHCQSTERVTGQPGAQSAGDTQDKGKTGMLRHFPSPSPSPPDWGHFTQLRPGKATPKRGISACAKHLPSLPTFCQAPLPGWTAFEAQCLSTAVPITSSPFCVLPHCLAMALSLKNQHQGIVPPGGLDPGQQ